MFFLSLFYNLAFAKPSEILFDFTTKRVLFARNINQIRYPASLTKKMTLYIIFQALKERRITFNTKFRISKYASKQPACKLGLKAGEYIYVKDIIYGIITKSANDASVVAAEGLEGSVKRFVNKMNSIARDLGMYNTHFSNPSGLFHAQQVSTSLDMLKLAYALYRDFPGYFSLFKKRYFYYKGRLITSHNRMLRHKNVDGMKTGYVNLSGYNITTSAVRYDIQGKAHRLFIVVMGEDTAAKRDKKALQLLNNFFRLKK